MAALVIALALTAVRPPIAVPLGIGDRIEGTIAASQHLSFRIKVPLGHVAHVLIHQHEVDIAADVATVTSDSTEWDYESVYIAGTESGSTELRLSAEAHGPRKGRFAIRVVSVVVQDDSRLAAMKAQAVESRGRQALAERKAQTIPTAEVDLNEAIRLWGVAGDRRREGQCRLAHGVALERLSRFRDADQEYVRAMALVEKTGDKAAFLAAKKTWINLGGHIGELRGNIEEVQRLLTTAESTMDRRIVAIYTKTLATAYRSALNFKKDWELKNKYLQLAIDLNDRTMETEAYDKLGAIAMSEKRYVEALKYAERSLSLSREMRDQGAEMSILSQMAAIFGFMGDHESSVRIRTDLQVLNEDRGDVPTWIANAIGLAENMNSLGRPAESAVILDEVQTRVNQTLQAADDFGAYFAGISQTDVSGPAAHLIRFGPKFAAAGYRYLDAQRGRFMAGHTKDQLATLQEALGSDTVLLEFVSAGYPNEEAFVWLVSNTSVDGFITEKVDTSAPVMEELAASLATNLTANLSAVLKLGTALLRPLKGHLRAKHVVVVTDENFANIPFAVFPDPDHDDGSSFADHHTITYAPSGMAIATRSYRRVAGGRTMFVAADPVTNDRDTRLLTAANTEPTPGDWIGTARAAGKILPGNQLPRLGFSTREARRISRELPAGKAEVLLGFDATKDSVLKALRNADFINLSSHAYTDLHRPKGSGLVFSFWNRKGLAVDGFLKLSDIWETEMRAEIVTLSACETAIGRVSGHSGVPSLANAFLKAGAKRVVSSLWRVDDAATEELMVQFYRNLFAKVSPGEALWKAQQVVRKTPGWANPYFWAGFTLSGDWRPL